MAVVGHDAGGGVRQTLSRPRHTFVMECCQWSHTAAARACVRAYNTSPCQEDRRQCGVVQLCMQTNEGTFTRRLARGVTPERRSR
eukprot:m.93702 g.93702  ORF g.93702 m.93702 type:complete len:85 (+) comp10012_c0_seq2:1438-1692(+)